MNSAARFNRAGIRRDRAPVWGAAMIAGVALAAGLAAAQPIMLGSPHIDAAKYNVEYQQYNRMEPLHKQNGIHAFLIERRPFLADPAPAPTNAVEPGEHLLRLLKQCHVVGLATTHEGAGFGPADQAHARIVGATLARYVQEGGGLLLMPQAVRYPNTSDEDYWNLVLEPLGVKVLHEGLYDKSRVYEGVTLGKALFWFTKNIRRHPVTEKVECLYLPLHGFNPFPGVPAIQYSQDWDIVVRGEQESKSYRSGTRESPNWINLEAEGTYTGAPPVVAVRTLGKGRLVCYPLAGLHTGGANYGNPLWSHVVETRGDRDAGQPSHSLQMIMNAIRWAAEPALANAELGTFKPEPYEPAVFPPSVDLSRIPFDQPTPTDGFTYPDGQVPSFQPAGDGVRGIVGARTAHAGGKGTVAEYAKAARAEGLSFIVFNDPLENLTPETFERLKAECAAASDTNFFACPGIEFTDGTSNRWACWSDRLLFPPATYDHHGKTWTQWDGKTMHLCGQYSVFANWPSLALIDYRQLKEHGQHQENMWWFWQFLPLVYEGDRQVADNIAAWRLAMRDMRFNTPYSYTRIADPSEVAKAARTCFTGFANLEQAQKCLRGGGSFHGPVRAGAYVSQGPVVRFWNAINNQMEFNWRQTKGAQRVRLKFVVASGNGIKEVLVHDADRGPVRRFIGQGEKEMAREFEMVHDKQHYLALEVVDTAGRRAHSSSLWVFSYKRGWFRCGDNLNILGSTGLLLHPDRLMMLEACVPFRNGEDFSLNGWDRGSPLCPMPKAESMETISTVEYGDRYPDRYKLDAMLGKVLEMDLNSYNLIGATMHMTRLARQDYYYGPDSGIARDVGDIAFFERHHTMVAPEDRVDWYVVWNARRRKEGSRDYRGSFIWHEGTIKFTRDVTLKGPVPIPLVAMSCPLDPDKGQGNILLVTEPGGVTRVKLVRDTTERVEAHGRLRPGGYASLMPSIVGYHGFLAAGDSDFAYTCSLPGQLLVGLGSDGQKVKAGTEVNYRFAVGAFADAKGGNDLLEHTVRAMNMGGGREGYPVEMTAGRCEDAAFFFTAMAEENEAAFTLGPRDLIIDLPIRVKGLEDNGCTAVYSTERPWFRFVPVEKGTAWFQEPIEKVNEMWVGNLFVCDHKDVKITAVVDGQAPDAAPFLELHNPTDKAVKTTVRSPDRTPRFGGLEAKVEIPAGSSIRLAVEGQTLKRSA